MQRFTTLLQREWLQHKLGWTIVVLAPILIAALVLLFAQVQISVNDAEAQLRLAQIPAVGIVLAAIVGTAALTMLAAWASAVIQAPGLARRDQQDRSIEFWLSLPVGHVPAVAAPLLAHLILFPAAAMVIGLLGGQLISLGLVGKVLGLSALGTVPWGTVIGVVVLLSLRVLLGLVLATLWLSPLILLAMAASAWLKRWGLPALLGSYAVVGLVLDKLYSNPIVWDLTAALTGNAGRALIATRDGGGLRFKAGQDPSAMLQAFPGWIATDAGLALSNLANPLLLGALLVSAACFGLLVLRRQRGA
jgi:ABC-2 type transport system permease protein